MKTGRTLFVDGQAGAAGDMILGALVDLGVPLARIRRGLEQLPLEGWTLRSHKVDRCGLAARKITVRVKQDVHGRGWAALRRIVRGGGLAPPVRDRCLAIFRRLIEAEAEVHGTTPEKVHLHEAGGTDAIVDVVGACIALEMLQVERIVVSPLTTGFGSVDCRHGVYPVPAPATLLLTRGVPVRAGSVETERLTPTGAAILTGVADAWGALPSMRPLAVGHGAGDREFERVPNLLRMVLGEAWLASSDAARQPDDGVIVIECNVDDSTPQVLAYATTRLLESGALDVFTTACTMKKGRPGHLLTVLARPGDLERLARVLFEETSTLGVRYRSERRIELERATRSVRTEFGPVRLKIGMLDGRVVQVWPEYADCEARALAHGVPLARVQQAALSASRERPAKRKPGGRGSSRTRR